MSGAVSMISMTQILVFGDSITYGAWDTKGGWVQRLRKFVDNKNLNEKNYYCIIYNLGISGDTTEWLLERFEKEIKSRLKELEKEEKLVIIISMGSNDCAFDNEKNKTDVSDAKFNENISKLIKIAKKFTSDLIFVGFNPVDESKVNPIPWNPSYSYINKDIQRFDSIVKKNCTDNELDFISIFEKLTNENYNKLLSYDGVHPNNEGHKRIFEEVKKILLEKKLI